MPAEEAVKTFLWVGNCMLENNMQLWTAIEGNSVIYHPVAHIVIHRQEITFKIITFPCPKPSEIMTTEGLIFACGNMMWEMIRLLHEISSPYCLVLSSVYLICTAETSYIHIT